MAVTASHRTAKTGLEYKCLYFHGTAQPLEERDLVRQAVG